MAEPVLAMSVSEFRRLLEQAGVPDFSLDPTATGVDGDTIDVIAYLAWLLDDKGKDADAAQQ